ncbi:hypothetical protein [Pantoea stewartii]|uniref:hypothetical protein n=1 Tax=Pantoea stewartii TaxID=66269 RepID=UPI00198044BF|nr:hypothetical protein [Pantoea stewartii]
MKTNSPNPVDGDVQGLIADCQAEIEKLEKAIKNINSYVKASYRNECLSKCQSELRRQQIALAALKAEPVYQFIANDPDKDGYIEWADCNPDYFSKEPTDMRRILYTAPRAQLLRPVELPDIEDNELAFNAGLNSLVDCLQDCGDAEQGLRLALRSISEKWHEVKS